MSCYLSFILTKYNGNTTVYYLIDLTVGLSFIMGANFLLLMYVINRIISASEIPISILTGIVRTPTFVICLLLKQRGDSKI